MDLFLRVEYADISLLGGREENQDRVSTAVAEHAALLVVVDGMGGHADGARAAEVTQQVIIEAFWHTPQPLFDPLGFLHLTLGRAHEEVVQARRATAARAAAARHLRGVPGAAARQLVGACRRQPHSIMCAAATLVARTRDHSHVELLLREGLISAEQAHNHPMRNFVECCLGGDPILPDMSLAPAPAASSRGRAAGVHRRPVGRAQGRGDRRRDRHARCRCARSSSSSASAP